MTEKELDQADHIYMHGGDPMPKPTDYKAEAQTFRRKYIADWLEQTFARRVLGQEIQVEALDTSIAALLERLCGEANSRAAHWQITADAHALMLMRAQDIAKSTEDVDILVHNLVTQLATAQKEIERLTAQRDALGEEANIQGDRAEKAEAAIEQAREEGYAAGLQAGRGDK